MGSTFNLTMVLATLSEYATTGLWVLFVVSVVVLGYTISKTNETEEDTPQVKSFLYTVSGYSSILSFVLGIIFSIFSYHISDNEFVLSEKNEKIILEETPGRHFGFDFRESVFFSKTAYSYCDSPTGVGFDISGGPIGGKIRCVALSINPTRFATHAKKLSQFAASNDASTPNTHLVLKEYWEMQKNRDIMDFPSFITLRPL